MTITATIVDAIKVQFLKPIFEADFPEKGMKAWLTDVQWDTSAECYKLFFDFTEFEADNDKYLQQTYYRNRCTDALGLDRALYTAKEAGYYDNKYSVYFSCGDCINRDDDAFVQDIVEYLREVE